MSETERPRRLPSVWAVLAGLLVVIVVTTVTDALMHATGVFPPFGQPMADALFLLAAAYRVLYGVAGGYVAARLAPRGPVRHAVAVGVIGSLLGAVGAAATWNSGPAFGPKWYSLAVIAIGVPSAWAGGILRAWQLRRARG